MATAKPPLSERMQLTANVVRSVGDLLEALERELEQELRDLKAQAGLPPRLVSIKGGRDA